MSRVRNARPLDYNHGLANFWRIGQPPLGDETMSESDDGYLIRQCITLRNGRRLCKPPGQAFRFPVLAKKLPDDKTDDE